MKLPLFILSFLLALAGMSAQHPDAPKVFLDCRTDCDMTYFRAELDFVHFMRDRQTADVYMQMSSVPTGAGGREYQLEVIGHGRFAGITDTLVFSTEATSTDDQRRQSQLQGLRKAVLPYVLETELGDELKYTVENSRDEATEILLDPWDFWVFNIGGNGNINGEESYRNVRLSGRFTASRVTEKNKFHWYSSFNYNKSTFDLGGGEEFVSFTRSLYASTKNVWSISDHLSIGGMAHVRTSTFSNIKFSTSIQPAIEYNIFPYSEATKRQFTIFYRVGPVFNKYIEPTLFDKMEEWVAFQSLEVGYQQMEQWGSLSLWIDANNYWHDFNRHSISVNPTIEWNVFKGFNINIGGRLSLIRDQISIPKSGISDEEILLRVRQLKSNYTYYGYVGVNYRFGSDFNNVVNTRF